MSTRVANMACRVRGGLFACETQVRLGGSLVVLLLVLQGPHATPLGRLAGPDGDLGGRIDRISCPFRGLFQHAP